MVTTGLLRLLPASEAADLRRQHREDFARRFREAMGYPCADLYLWKWYESSPEEWWPE